MSGGRVELWPSPPKFIACTTFASGTNVRLIVFSDLHHDLSPRIHPALLRVRRRLVVLGTVVSHFSDIYLLPSLQVNSSCH